MLIVGVDASFQGFGVVGLGMEKDAPPSRPLQVCYSLLPKQENWNFRNFQDVVHASYKLGPQFVRAVTDMAYFTKTEQTEVVIEMPPPRSILSAGLWGLDVHCLCELYNSVDFPCALAAYGCSTMLVKKITGGRKAKKEESVRVVSQNWNWFINHASFHRITKGVADTRIQEEAHADLSDHNLCDALIMAFVYAYCKGKLPLIPSFISDMKPDNKFPVIF